MSIPGKIGAQPDPPALESTSDDVALVRALNERDERAFKSIVDRWSPTMLKLALAQVESRALAEEIVQEAWLTVLKTLDRFEHRSSLKTWVLGIVVNLARSRARAERRNDAVPLDSTGSVLDPKRFLSASHPRWPNHWTAPPAPWPSPIDKVLADEVQEVILRAVDELPPAQREVLVMRDIQGMDATETCNVLKLSGTNQRVLLHRARTRVRAAVERYYSQAEGQ